MKAHLTSSAFRLPLIASLILGITSCQKKETDTHATKHKELPAVAVQTTPATVVTTPAFEHAVGTVRPKLEATISSDIGGRILEYLVVSGQKVNKGDLIARIDAPELAASKLRAQAQLKQAELELARQRKLIARNATSRARLEQALAAERIARASLRQIEASLAKANVKAPFNGTISRKLADTGDLATPGKPLAILEDSTNLRLEVPVAESLAGNLTLKQPIDVELDALDLHLQGEISELEPSADPASRTFLVKIDLPRNKDIRAGLFGKALIPRGQRQVIIIPASCLLRHGQIESVFIDNNKKAQLRLVRSVPHRNDKILILSGLHANEQVILDPPATLVDGSPLKVAK